jgi:hypothetical protein
MRAAAAAEDAAAADAVAAPPAYCMEEEASSTRCTCADSESPRLRDENLNGGSTQQPAGRALTWTGCGPSERLAAKGEARPG